jgi:hypothetical protein
MDFSSIECFFFVVAFLAIGEFVSTKTKSYVPSVFIAALCFLIGYWTFVPKDFVANGSFGKQFVPVCMSLLLVHLGTLMSLRKLIAQWKAVTVAVIGICGTILITMTIGRLLFDYQVVVAVTPPLTGGIVAALLMSQALSAKGFTTLVALPVAMFVMHSFVGYPITSFCLKKESVRIMKDYRANGPDPNVLKESMSAHSERKKLIPRVPENYLSPYLILAKIILVGILASFLSNLTQGAVNQYIICLILGVIFCEVGFLEESALVKAGVFNWLMVGLLAYVFSTLNTVTFAVLGKIIVPTITLIILGILGMFLTSSISGKLLGFSKEMGFACALTALFGFPADYIITTECIKSQSNTEEERQYLTDILLPRMLVGGFATVSIASVVVATVFINLL